MPKRKQQLIDALAKPSPELVPGQSILPEVRHPGVEHAVQRLLQLGRHDHFALDGKLQLR